MDFAVVYPFRKDSRFKKHSRNICIFGIFLLIIGCITVPRQEFNIYRENFGTAKSAAEEVILRAQVAAETVAKSPDNPNGPNVRQKNLNERTAALDARLQALALIAQYNDVLVCLASGADSTAVRGNLEILRYGLGSFGISQLTVLAEKAAPLIGIITQAVKLMDDLIERQQFKEAVDAAQKPILQIIAILVQDADKIHEIEEQLTLLKRDQEESQIRKLKKRLGPVANTFKQSSGLDRIISRHNTLVDGLKDKEIAKHYLIKHSPNPQADTPAGPIELETMKTVVDQFAGISGNLTIILIKQRFILLSAHLKPEFYRI